MDDKLDKILKHALTPREEPDFWLDQNILNQAKEREEMNKKTVKTIRRIPAAALAAVIVLGCGSITAFAAWKYLTPQNVAQEFGQTKLAEAFSGKDAVSVNETQSYGGYDVTLLGLISGENLSIYKGFDDNGGELETDKTYSVVAIKNSDGTPMPKTSDDEYGQKSFFVSPLIKGYRPWQYNAASMSGGYGEFSENGVLYRIAECDNVEMFADHGLYLCVNDGVFYNNNAYLFDEDTGEISRNEEYSGLNALFELPIDASKADPEAAAEYIAEMEKEEEEEEVIDEHSDTPEQSEAEKWFDQLTAENINKYAKRVEDSVQILKPDEDGYITYGMDGTALVSWLFSSGNKFVIDGGSSSGDKLEDLEIYTFELNDDGTVTYAVYVPKEIVKTVEKR